MATVKVLIEKQLPSPFDFARAVDIARELGVSLSYITRIKNGRVRLSQEQYNKIMKLALDISSSL